MSGDNWDRWCDLKALGKDAEADEEINGLMKTILGNIYKTITSKTTIPESSKKTIPETSKKTILETSKKTNPGNFSPWTKKIKRKSTDRTQVPNKCIARTPLPAWNPPQPTPPPAHTLTNQAQPSSTVNTPMDTSPLLPTTSHTPS